MSLAQMNNLTFFVHYSEIVVVLAASGDSK
jgi:hypothetical protein